MGMLAIEQHFARRLFKRVKTNLPQCHKPHRGDPDDKSTINLRGVSRLARDLEDLIRERDTTTCSDIHRTEFARVFLRFAFHLRPVTMTVKKRVRRIDLIAKPVVALYQQL